MNNNNQKIYNLKKLINQLLDYLKYIYETEDIKFLNLIYPTLQILINKELNE